MYHVSFQIYKTVNNLSPTRINDLLTFSNNSTHALRSATHNNLSLTKIPKKNYYADTFSYMSMLVWNDFFGIK